MRVAIIGAGSAGMAMAKQLVEASGGAVPFVVYERRSEVGGIWQYDETVPPGYLAWEDDQARLHRIRSRESLARGSGTDGTRPRTRIGWAGAYPPGPMFDGLRTNIPSDLMTYRDAPFKTGTSLFPSRATVQSYLEHYATLHDLRRHVRFHTAVKRIRKETRDSEWIVTTQSVQAEEAMANGDTMQEERFTHLVLAHGRCNTPNIPSIPGIETFAGRITHSQWYRDPTTLMQPHEKKKVLVVGNASSAMDISRELSGYITRTLPCGLDADAWAKQCKEQPFEVLQSWHSPDKPPPMDYNPLDPDSPDWCRRIQIVASIDRIEGSRIFLADGRVLDDVPLILFGTGYLFDNAFMDQSRGPLCSHPLLPPSNDPTRRGVPSPSIYNLDDWLLFHRKDETLAMLGLAVTVVPFPFTEIQSAYVARRWLGKASKLPRLDCNHAPNDAERWQSRARGGAVEQQKESIETPTGNGIKAPRDVILRTQPHVFGTPSDVAYVDALLRLLQNANELAGVPAPWSDAYKQSSNERGDGDPRGPENLYATAPWRVERRSNGRVLRRATLGY